MKRFLVFSLLCASAFGQSVQQSLNRLGNGPNWVLAFNWTAGSNGAVPVTNADFRGAGGDCCQGYFIVQVETVPLSPAPTSGYSVAINDAAGVDALGGAAASLSAVTPQSFASAASAPAVQGTFSLVITGQSVNGAKGTVFVFLQKPGTVNLAKLGSGGGGASSANWLTIANPPFVDTRRYNFTPQSPGAALSAGACSFTMRPVPTGLLATDYLYISGGTGTAEAVPVTSIVGNTVNATCANSHSGAYTVASATAGIQQAVNVATVGSIVQVPSGATQVWAETRISKQLRIRGGMATDNIGTEILPQTAGQTIFHVIGTSVTIEYLAIHFAVAQATGQMTINLDGTYGDTIRYIDTRNDWYSIYMTDSGGDYIDHCRFGQFYGDAIRVYSATVDATGPSITNNTFYSPSSAHAAINHVTTGGLTIQGNGFHNNSAYGYYGAMSGGSSQVLITGNTFDGQTAAGIFISPSVTYIGFTITGNFISNFLSASSYAGIWVNSTNAVGGAVTGNFISPWYTTGAVAGIAGIILNGSEWIATGNTIWHSYVALQSSSGVDVTFSAHHVFDITVPFLGGGTNVRLNSPFNMTYAQMTAYTVADGSTVYATNANTGCSSATGTGATCFREGGAWTH